MTRRIDASNRTSLFPALLLATCSLTWGSGAAAQSMATGTYTGNGTSQTISAPGFQPDVVITMGHTGANRRSMWKIASMGANQSRQVNGGSTFATNGITAFTSTGFSVGSHDFANANNVTYSYIAMANVGNPQTGSYTGNGTTQTISGPGYLPDLVVTFPDGSGQPSWRSQDHATNNSNRFGNAVLQTADITAMTSSGFTVGSGSNVNTNGTVYHYLTIQNAGGLHAQGTYTGNATARTITSADETRVIPRFLWVKTSGQRNTMRIETMPNSKEWRGPLVTDGITSMSSTTDEFDVGADARVNANNATIFWVAFGDDLSVPVTLSSFQATQSGAGAIDLRWQTQTETRNAGFYLLGQAGNGQWKRIGPELIPGAVDSLTARPYSVRIPAGERYSAFRLAHVSTTGATKFHGPFVPGKRFGARAVARPAINWTKLGDSVLQQRKTRIDQRIQQLAPRVARLRRASQRRHVAGTLDLDLQQSGVGRLSQALSGSEAEASFGVEVSRTGMHRLSYEALRDAGFDLAGLPVAEFSLTLAGKPQAIRVRGSDRDSEQFGPGAYIDFYGQAVSDSIYTKRRLYLLQRTPGATRWAATGAEPDQAKPARETYLAQVEVADNNEYSLRAPAGDPWFRSRYLAYKDKPQSWDVSLKLDHTAGEAADFRADYWGVTDFSKVDGDHHLRIKLNGTIIKDTVFDGPRRSTESIAVPMSLVKEGANVVTFELPGDTDAEYDMVALDRVAIRYPRKFVAREGSLAFRASGQRFAIEGLPAGTDVVAYRHDAAGQLVWLPTRRTDGGALSLAGHDDGEEHGYWVGEASRLLIPALRPLASDAGHDAVPDGQADYLIIAHPDFIGGLEPLVEARQSQGLSVQVVDVERVYQRYSGGVVDPEAIRTFIRDTAAATALKYVLLVGGDSYDYFDHLKLGSISFIPSLYRHIGNEQFFSPVDPLYGDIDNDEVPDLPVGRFPVRTPQELELLINKQLRFDQDATPAANALFIADDNEGELSFADISDRIVGELPGDWRFDTFYLDRDNRKVAAEQVFKKLNGGDHRLVSFFGHSGPTSWTFDDLLNADDLTALSNPKPMLVTQWGCWNTYHAHPKYHTMAHRFLLSGKHGAAAVLGASTLTYAGSEERLAKAVMRRLALPEMTIGQAVQQAKNELAGAQRSPTTFQDVILGWSLLGDPAGRVGPAPAPASPEEPAAQPEPGKARQQPAAAEGDPTASDQPKASAGCSVTSNAPAPTLLLCLALLLWLARRGRSLHS